MVYTQENRILALSTPLGKDALLLTKFTGREGLTRPSRFTLDTLSEFEIDPKELIGKPVNFDVELDDGSYRVFNGLVDTVSPKGLVDSDFRRYELKIITQIDQLKKKSDNRIFQNQSLLETITEVLDEHKVMWSTITNGDYQPLEYCVQYQETDYQFVHRLLSEAGINYRITHKAGEHTVVLFDHITHYQQTKEPVVEYVDGGSAQRKFYHWQKTVKMTSGKSSQRSFNFNRPLETVKSQTQTIAPQDASLNYERYTYPGLNNDSASSGLESRRKMEQVENTHTQVSVSTSCRTLEPGHTFSFDRHVIERECEFDYVVTTVDYVAIDDTYVNQSGDAQVLESHLQCIPKHVLYRPTKQYPRPVVTGTQTAIVCGKAGEEIHTDELGRIRVQFHWDRIGQRDENTACWMRVAQPWSNNGYGGQYIPRIGQEVLVHFEEGDINKPLVQGTVYNGRNKPAFDLPANKTQSGSKTRSSKGADPVQYNEIRFEDKKGQEDLHVQAQKNQTTVIKDSQTRAIGNQQLLSVGKNKFEVIKNNRDTVINKGHDMLQTQGDISMQSVNGGIVFEAKNNIEFEVGKAQICLTSAGHLLLNGALVNVDGSMVNINGGYSPPGKRLSPMKVDDIFTTPTTGGTAVRDIAFAVEKNSAIAPIDANGNSRAALAPVLQQSLDQSGVTLDEVYALSPDIFTTNQQNQLVLKPVVPKSPSEIDRNAILTQDVVNRMQARIHLNDRANAYLELYNATGSEQLILQSQITTYSGIIGAFALTGNMLAKDMAGANYNVSLDQFSKDILQGTHDLAADFVGGKAKALATNNLQEADWHVWNSKGMGHLFPGNAQFADSAFHSNVTLAKKIFDSQGTMNTLQMAQESKMIFQEITKLGNRPADFANLEGYTIFDDGGRFIRVVDSNGITQNFWDNAPFVNPAESPVDFVPEWLQTLSQTDNVPRSQDSDALELGNAVRQYVQADSPSIMPYDSNYSFEEFGSNNSLIKTFRKDLRAEDVIPNIIKKGGDSINSFDAINQAGSFDLPASFGPTN